MLEWTTGKVIDIQDETPTTKKFFIEIQNTQDFVFQSGQFVTLDLPIHEQKINVGEAIPLLLHLTEPMLLN